VVLVRVPAIVPRVVVTAVLVAAAAFPAGALASPPSSTAVVEVSAAVRQDVSPPLRNLGPSAPSAATLRERPLRLVGPGSSPNQADGAVQTTTGAAVATTGVLNFAGVGAGDYGFTDQYAPPDTSGAAGATQYVQWVNTYFAVFDKKTGAIAGGFPKPGNAVWAGFGGGCETNNDGDPIVQYDKAANRWILTQFSVSTTPYLQCVAVSTTSDATGSYYRYAFSYGSTQFPDYPKLGVWPDAYYITFNMFTSTFVGAKVCAYDRMAMLTGAAATQQCFQLSNSYGGLLPADLDGSTAPPPGAPNFVMSFGSNSLNLWKFHVDFGTPANTTFTGPVNLPVASFSRACNGSNCVPQPGTSQKLDSLGDRLMYRLAYRNFGGHESLVLNHSVSVGGNLFKSGVSSVRWYELRNAPGSTIAGTAPIVYQQGTLGASDGIHRWMGSLAMDKVGNIALGYSASSGSVYPSIRYTGRVPADSLGTMEAESIIQAGGGSQLQNLSRWGDYSAMTVDPVDDCTFWYTNEYLKANGTWNWSTRIASFTFPGCLGTASQAPAITSPAGTTFTIGTPGNFTVTATGSPTPAISESGLLPSGVTFVPNANGTATLSGTPAAGSASSYQITFTAANGVGADASQAFTLTVNPSSSGVPGQPAPPSAKAGPGKGVSLTWTPPTNGGSAITGYTLNRYVACDPSTSPFVLNPGNVLSYRDTSTSAGTSYCYTVAAANGAGPGPASQPSNTVTPSK
jgi:hypothetical protein